MLGEDRENQVAAHYPGPAAFPEAGPSGHQSAIHLPGFPAARGCAASWPVVVVIGWSSRSVRGCPERIPA
jgi:hypothetical protein